MALKIKKKKEEKLLEQEEKEKYIEIKISKNIKTSQRSFETHKKATKELIKKGYDKKSLKKMIKEIYLDNLLDIKRLNQQTQNQQKLLQQTNNLYENIKNILLNYLLNEKDEEQKLEKELITDTLKFFQKLIYANKEELDDIILYSAYKEPNDKEKKITLYNRIEKELKIYHKEIKEKGTNLTNLFALIKFMDFISKDILTEKNIYLLGSMNKITKHNTNKPVFIDSRSIMNYGHLLESFTILNRIKEEELSLNRYHQFEINDWNDFFQYHKSEAEKFGIKDIEEYEKLSSVDIKEETPKKVKLIEVKHYSETEEQFNLYLKRPHMMEKNFNKLTIFGKVIGELKMKEGESVYDITMYDKEGNIHRIEIKMEDYIKLFKNIGEQIIKANSKEEFFNSKSYISKELLFENEYLTYKLDINQKKTKKINEEEYKKENIFQTGTNITNIRQIVLSFDNIEIYKNLLLKYGGKEKEKKQENKILKTKNNLNKL